MPALYYSQDTETSLSNGVWRRATGDKDWFHQNSTTIYILISAAITILSTITIFLFWNVVLRKRLRARGFCLPTSRRPKVPITDLSNHSDAYSTYCDDSDEEEVDEKARWQRRTIRIDWADPAKRRSSFFAGAGKAPPSVKRGRAQLWDAEGRDRLLPHREAETGYGRRETSSFSSQPPMSPVNRTQASMARMEYQVDAREHYGHTSRPSHSSTFGPSARSVQRPPHNPFSDPESAYIHPRASPLPTQPGVKSHYHPYPIFALSSAPVVIVIPKTDLRYGDKPEYLPCPVNILGSYTSTPPLTPSSSSSSLSSGSSSSHLATPQSHPYPISTTPINHRPTPPSSPPPLVISHPYIPRPSHIGFSDSHSPHTPWKSFRDSFRALPSRTDGEEDEYDHYQLPIIRPGSSFAPAFTNILDKEHRDRARDRISTMSTASGRPDRSSRMYEQLWVDTDEPGGGGRGGAYRESASRVSSIYPPANLSLSSRGRDGGSSFAVAKTARRTRPSPLGQINEI